MEIKEPLTQEMINHIRLKGSELCSCWRTVNKTCSLGHAEMYEHDGGCFIEGRKEKQWLYFTCTRCNYQWAWHKILSKINR